MNYTTRADTYYGNNSTTGINNIFWNGVPDINNYTTGTDSICWNLFQNIRSTDSYIVTDDLVPTGGYSRTIVTGSGNRYTWTQPKYRFTYYRDTEEDLEDNELMDFLDGFRGTEYE